jgi:hypothetical protein
MAHERTRPKSYLVELPPEVHKRDRKIAFAIDFYRNMRWVGCAAARVFLCELFALGRNEEKF